MAEEGREALIPATLKKMEGGSGDEPSIFSTETAEGTSEVVERMVGAANTFHDMAIDDFGGKTGSERETGLVEQVVGAAFQTFEGFDPHPDPFDKAAMLMQGITQGHPYTDGNKRTGFLTAAYYLGHVGLPLPDDLPEDEVVDFCVQVSSGAIRDVDVIAQGLQRFWHATS